MFKSIFLILIVIFFLTGCGKNEDINSVNNSSNTQISRTSTYDNNSNTIAPPVQNEISTQTPPENVAPAKDIVPPREDNPVTEEEISSFSTKIYTKDSERQNNVKITSDKLNGTIVNSGDTFSFTGTIGKATKAKGYEEADIFDSDGNKVKGLGGGNCQVSSTLYNSVLNTPNLKVVERHEHSNKVPYVKPGKDAAVAYGSVDFKFKNENFYNIKIYAEATKNKVNIRIMKIN